MPKNERIGNFLTFLTFLTFLIMKKIMVLLIILSTCYYSSFAQCNTNCSQLLQNFNYTKFNSYTSSVDNWQYFGSLNQTRVRVVVEYTSTPNSAHIGLGVCGCPNDITGTNQCVVQLNIRVEAESKVGLNGKWQKRNTFNPDFKLVFNGLSVVNKGNTLVTQPNVMCDLIGDCSLPNSYFFITNNSGYDGASGLVPNNWNLIVNGTLQKNNTNFSSFSLKPSGTYSISTKSWFTQHPTPIGTIQCYVKIAGINGWSNMGNITL